MQVFELKVAVSVGHFHTECASAEEFFYESRYLCQLVVTLSHFS
jgi:hypothetical protein